MRAPVFRKTLYFEGLAPECLTRIAERKTPEFHGVLYGSNSFRKLANHAAARSLSFSIQSRTNCGHEMIPNLRPSPSIRYARAARSASSS